MLFKQITHIIIKIIAEIDAILAKHYDFTDEELDFIINYDIKYRMGKNLKTVKNNDNCKHWKYRPFIIILKCF